MARYSKDTSTYRITLTMLILLALVNVTRGYHDEDVFLYFFNQYSPDYGDQGLTCMDIDSMNNYRVYGGYISINNQNNPFIGLKTDTIYMNDPQNW